MANFLCISKIVVVLLAAVTTILLFIHDRTFYLHPDKISIDRPKSRVVFFEVNGTGLDATSPLSYVLHKKRNVFILGAVNLNSSKNTVWDHISITAWIHTTYSTENISCCLMYSDGKTRLSDILYTTFTPTGKNTKLSGRFLLCTNPLSKSKQRPVGATVSLYGKRCIKNKDFYATTYRAFNTSGDQVGVCTKVAYGTLSAAALIEWFELHRLVGVNKVITYIDKSLNQEARRVLAYYQSMGLLTAYKFDLPLQDTFRRHVGQKRAQSFNDEALTAFDCAARLRGYRYVSIFDFDEFIIPSENRTWQHTLRKLFHDTPRAGGFVLQTAVYVTSWQKDNNSDFMVNQYTTRTKPMIDRPKVIFMPERAFVHGTHHVSYATGYKKIPCPTSDMVIRHFRSCRRSWEQRNDDGTSLCIPKNKTITIRDMFLPNRISPIRDKVLQIRKLVLGY